ncbi:MAG: hypothetical protein QG551_129 [Patescibacteria group bacterium]|jgi:hypothetical protein|nr:hypothetical protein [Patescibacteria group bacterium]
MDTDKNNQINDSLTGSDANTMHNAGVDIATEEETFVDIDSTKPKADDADLKSVGLQFVDSKTLEKEEPKVAPVKEVVEEKIASTDLEKEFSNTVGGVSSSKTSVSTASVSSLNTLLSKIKDKLGMKKREVKSELENLKKIKEEITEDIQNIKELEESEKKIESQLGKIESINNEINQIEEEVKGELLK